MRKWCPEPFDHDLQETETPATAMVPFVRDLPVSVSLSGESEALDDGFVKDQILGRGQDLWDQLSKAEKEQLLQTSRSQLEEEFEAREKELDRQHQEKLAAMADEFEHRLENWSLQLSAQTDLEIQHMADKAARLSLVLARKIIRDTVEIDPEFLIRTMETALYKIRGSHPVIVILHPEDASWLENTPELRDRLRISEVVADRRVEKGGCRLRSGVREWDATLARQMDTLAEVMDEYLEVAGPLPLTVPGGEDDSHLE